MATLDKFFAEKKQFHPKVQKPECWFVETEGLFVNFSLHEGKIWHFQMISPQVA